MKFPSPPAALDPSRFVKFKSRAHDERVAAILGASLGICFFTCFFTGLISHFMQHPPSWYDWPTNPSWFYRVTQGLHVTTGLFVIPILLAKLWVIYPKLFEFPPVEGIAHFLERISLLPLIGGGLFMVTTGVANIFQWYFFPFFFTSTHYAMAWVTIGALIVHMGAKWTITRKQFLTRDHPRLDDEVDGDHVTRRGFLMGVFGASGLLTLFTVGQTFSPLAKTALLSPRRAGDGPQNLPVNQTAGGAGVITKAQSADYRLIVDGRVSTPLSFSLADLNGLVQHEHSLPITCVEGWSSGAHWKGVRVRDLLAMAGAPKHATVRVESIQEGSIYAQSILNRYHAADPDTLLALQVNGETLNLDHGFPCRLIGPNRPGVLQTKWVKKLVVL